MLVLVAAATFLLALGSRVRGNDEGKGSSIPPKFTKVYTVSGLSTGARNQRDRRGISDEKQPLTAWHKRGAVGKFILGMSDFGWKADIPPKH